jgi:hypothetical protein
MVGGDAGDRRGERYEAVSPGVHPDFNSGRVLDGKELQEERAVTRRSTGYETLHPARAASPIFTLPNVAA